MKKYFQSNFVIVTALFLVAALLLTAVYPEIFITFKTSFILWSDYCIDYPLTFVLTNFFYQGGIQLWDFFGQMPYFHTYAVFGLFKFPNVMTAMVYYALAPFSEDSGRLFHHVFAWVNLMTLLFIRLAGIFLLLKTVTRNRVILTAGTVIFAGFFSQWAFLKGGFYMSYFPLGMYFIVRFFQGLQWRYLAAMFLFFIISLGNGVHYGGYMYLPMHFFMVTGILWRAFFRPSSSNSTNVYSWKSFRWESMRWVILVAAFIVAPYAYIIKFGFPDLAFDQANSRISHPFSPQWYFHNPDLDLGNPGSMFSGVLNMHTGFDTFYLGLSFLFLAMAGLVLSRNALKWFFGIGVAFLWFLSFPREGINIGLIAHWINALTNPLKAIPRAYQYPFQSMLPYLLMPLVVMGIESMRELYDGKKYSGAAVLALGTTMFSMVFSGITALHFGSKVYMVTCTMVMMAAMALIYFKDSSQARAFLLGTLCLLFVMDIFFIIHQSKMKLAPFIRKPTVLDVSPSSGMVGYDFENPAIFPYRYSYTLHFSYRDEVYLWFPHAVSSDLHHVINQGLNYTYLNGYNPRHVEFAKWLNDPPMLAYLKQNNEFIFLAQAAINASPDALSRICSAGLARQVVEVEDPHRELQLPDEWPGNVMNQGQKDLQYSQISAALEDVTERSEYHLQGDMIVYNWHLPLNFPAHLATSFFPAEQRYLRFFIEGTEQHWQELQPTQGELIRPYTFDVQNIEKGDLKAAFPMNDFPLHRKCVLFYPSSENQGVEGLWRRQFDNLGITYRAKRNGWFVGHYPYDSKWRISVDGKTVPYYRVNESFVGFPLSQGEHKILIQYWPHSPLRALLLISALLTTFGLPVLIFLGLKWEQDPNKQITNQ